MAQAEVMTPGTSRLEIYDILTTVLNPPIVGELSVSAMRWKLLLLASLVAAILGFGLWCALTVALFGTATQLARHDWIFLASSLLPLVVAVFSGVFVYRHTARRRKTQAILSALLTLALASLGYFITLKLSPDRFRVSRANKTIVR
jgi:cytochrome bd-type quinol oxidase subunit 2